MERKLVLENQMLRAALYDTARENDRLWGIVEDLNHEVEQQQMTIDMYKRANGDSGESMLLFDGEPIERIPPKKPGFWARLMGAT